MKWSRIVPETMGTRDGFVEVDRVVLDSRQAGPGAIFVAIPGRTVDGYDYIPEAIRRGVSAIVSTRLHPEAQDTPFWVHPNWQEALGYVCAQLYGTGETPLVLTAVTGTDGKTTTTAFLRMLLEWGEIPTASIGTLGFYRPGEKKPEAEAEYTTPLAPDLHDRLRQLSREQAAECVLEASSQAIVQGRLAGLAFDRVILTHLAVDHLDYHGSVENYAKAKLQLWAQLRETGISVLPGTDPLAWQVALTYPQKRHLWYFADPEHPLAREAWSFCQGEESDARVSDQQWQEELRVRGQDYGAEWFQWAETLRGKWTFERRRQFWLQQNCWFVREIQKTQEGFAFRIVGPQVDCKVSLPVFGVYNLSNALAAWVGATSVLEEGVLAQGLSSLEGVAGRMESLVQGQPYQVVVDFAHTVGSTRAVLEELRAHVSDGRLVTLCNASGDRDRAKRPQIAKLCSELADFVILTLEEVGEEDPRQILSELQSGLSRPADWVIPFRPEAIQKAIDALRPGDMLLLPALGAETACRVGKGKVAYSDRDWACACLRNRIWKEKLIEHLQRCGEKCPDIWLGSEP